MDKYISIKENALILTIPKNSNVTIDLHSKYNISDLIIEIGENSDVVIINQTNVNTSRAIIRKKSKVKVIKYLFDNNNADVSLAEEWKLEDDSHLNILDLESSKNSIKSYEYILSGENSSVEHKSGLFYDNQNNCKLTTKQIHANKNTSSSVIVKTVLLGEAISNYNSLISIDSNSDNSQAIQNHTSLVLSEYARNISIPSLEVKCCKAFCKHGSATGYINQEHLWYLQSKGFSQEEAFKLILYGFFNDLLNDINLLDFHCTLDTFYNRILLKI